VYVCKHAFFCALDVLLGNVRSATRFFGASVREDMNNVCAVCAFMMSNVRTHKHSAARFLGGASVCVVCVK